MKRSHCKIPFVYLFVCVTAYSFAQDRRAQIVQAGVAYGSGVVTGPDGEVFEGKVTFNDNAGIVTVEHDGESWSFTPKKATGFSFDDEVLMRRRIFHVFDYTNDDTGFTGPAFFEVLGEFESFAVLAKIDPVEVKPRKGLLMPRPSRTMVTDGSPMVAFQRETIFIMNGQGELQPYVRYTEKDANGLPDLHTNRKTFIERDLLQAYMGDYAEKVEAFAKTNDLRFKVKEDLVRILAHYKELLAN